MGSKCRFCLNDKLSTGASWCPNCGLIEPIVEGTLAIDLLPADCLRVGDLRFFVCQNRECEKPVMSPEVMYETQQRIKDEIIGGASGGRSSYNALIEGWSFILYGEPTSKLQRYVNAKSVAAFHCNSCNRSIFYHKAGHLRTFAATRALFLSPMLIIGPMLAAFGLSIYLFNGSFWLILSAMIAIPIVGVLRLYIPLMGKRAMPNGVEAALAIAEEAGAVNG